MSKQSDRSRFIETDPGTFVFHPSKERTKSRFKRTKEQIRALLRGDDEIIAPMLSIMGSEDDYPRRANGQFVDKHVIAKAANDPAEADKLRATLPEAEQPKLDKILTHLLQDGTIHHPREAPGLAINRDGVIEDEAWAAYAEANALRSEWEQRAATRNARQKGTATLTGAVRAINPTRTSKSLVSTHDKIENLSIEEARDEIGSALKAISTLYDEVDTQLTSATPANQRAVSRLRRRAEVKLDIATEAYIAQLKRDRRSDAPDTEQDKLTERFDNLICAVQDTCTEISDMYEDIIESLCRCIEEEAEDDTEPVAPTMPVDPDSSALSTDAEGYEHKGKGKGGGQFTGKGGGKTGSAGNTRLTAKSKTAAASALESPPEEVERLLRPWDGSIMWDNEEIHKLKLPTQIVSVSKLDWYLDMPCWDPSGERASKPDGKPGISPRDVLNHPGFWPGHDKRIAEADTSYPLDILKMKGKLLILDGLHRLLKLMKEGKKNIQARIVPQDDFDRIEKKTRLENPETTKDE